MRVCLWTTESQGWFMRRKMNGSLTKIVVLFFWNIQQKWYWHIQWLWGRVFFHSVCNKYWAWTVWGNASLLSAPQSSGTTPRSSISAANKSHAKPGRSAVVDLLGSNCVIKRFWTSWNHRLTRSTLMVSSSATLRALLRELRCRFLQPRSVPTVPRDKDWFFSMAHLFSL